MKSDYKDIVVKKPWGFEYLAYENEFVGLWFLYINEGHKTSFHCHPAKTSGLYVIKGKAKVSFFENNYKLTTGQKMMIRKGLFHSTKSLSKGGTLIFEIETPKDKKDLIRLSDSYGRTAKPYEGKSEEYKKNKDCIWIVDPEKNSEKFYNIQGIKLKVENIDSSESLNERNDQENLIFLRGGILCNKKIITRPGDIVAIKTIKKLLKTFKDVEKNTIILTIENG